ncbi:MAG: hypothetical protein E7286_04375 [Lachnospiraceae bacterium]|nr:hypothetical protein [Lachnospiraceae bacterium]
MDKKNRKNKKNLMECNDREQMIKDAQEKLRWYALEASEEEFDEEEVDKLVIFLEKEEAEFWAKKVGDKKIIGFNRWGITAAVIIGVLGLTIAGASMNSAQAWEAEGFFNRLRRDKEGQTMITSPDGLGMDVEQPEYYYELEDVPEEYQKYLFVSDIISELGEGELDGIVVENSDAFQKVRESWYVKGNKKLSAGVVIYEGEVRVVRDKYDQYRYQYSYSVDNYEHDIFEKEDANGEKEYSIFFYDKNKKYFVAGQLDVERMKELAIEYMNFVIK